MNYAKKAALISGFVFPGAGHIFLARYLLGSIFLVPALITVGFLLNHLTRRVIDVTQLIINREVEPSYSVIRSLLYSDQTQQINMAFMIFLIVWFVGILDSYRIGRAKDRREQNG